MITVPVGTQSELDVLVTPDMTVDFEELGPVHPVYATYWIAKHMEEVSRKLILPFLEVGEDGIGHSLDVRHVRPAAVGARVRISAVTVDADVKDNHVVTVCRALTDGDELVAEGHTEQVVLPRSVIERRFDRIKSSSH